MFSLSLSTVGLHDCVVGSSQKSFERLWLSRVGADDDGFLCPSSKHLLTVGYSELETLHILT